MSMKIRLWPLLLLGTLVLVLSPQVAYSQYKIGAQNVDTDGDGLSDEDELNKYLTNPTNKDTDGNGVPDGDWSERRQFTYTIRAMVRVLKPCATTPVSDDHQDVRVVDETDKYVDLEIVAYLWHRGLDYFRLPDFRVKLASRRQFTRLPDNLQWRDDYGKMTEWLKPGKICNWDDAMREEIIEELRNARVDVDQLTDTDLVETVAVWLYETSRCQSKTALSYHFQNDGRNWVLPNSFELYFARNSPLDGRGWFDYADLVFSAKKMWEKKTYEWGMPFACYMASTLRALGIPTRIVQFVPIINADNRDQRFYLAQAIKPDVVKNYLDDNARYFFANQMLQDPVQVVTMNEVYVGNSWRLLYLPKTLRGLIFPATPVQYHASPGYLLRVHTFADPGDFNYSETWGRQAAGQFSMKDLPGPTPFRILSLTPRVGKYNRLIINGLTNIDTLVDNSADSALDGLVVEGQGDANPAAPRTDTGNTYMAGLMAGSGLFELPTSAAEQLYFNIRPQYFLKKPMATNAPDSAVVADSGWAGYKFFPPAAPQLASAVPLADRPSNAQGRRPPDGVKSNVARLAVVTPPPKLVYSVLRAFWFDSPLRPPTIPPLLVNTNDGGGTFLVQVDRGGDNQTLDETFLKFCARDFVLRSAGNSAVKVQMMPLYWKDYFVLKVPKAEYARMIGGMPYRLTTAEQTSEYQWKVAGGVFLEKPGQE